MPRRPRSALAGALLALAAIAGPARAAAPAPAELTLVSYAVAKPLFAKVIPEFQKAWKEQTGQDVRFKESYGPSGAQTRAIAGGLEADVLATNLQSLVPPLVQAGLVKGDWATRLPGGASPAHSVIAIIVRAGNPKRIRSWEDIAAPGVEVVAINPKTSGNARWGVLAGYGALLREKGQAAADAWVEGLVRNTRTLASGGREATDAFVKNGVGDVLLTFENEALFAARATGAPIEYVVPAVNVRTDFPVVVVDGVVDRRGTRAVAEAFARFLFGPRAQALYAEAGYRPADPAARRGADARFREVPKLFSVDDLGGWPKVDAALFADGAVYDRAQAARQAAATAPRRGWRPSRLEVAVLAYLALAGAVPLAAAVLQLAGTPAADVWRAVTAPAALAAITLSVEVALVAALLNAPLGLLVAWVLGRYRFPGRRLLDALVDLPLAIPGVVAGISFMSLFGPAGHVGRVVGAAFAPGGLLAWSGLGAPRLAGSRAGLVLAGLYVTLPFVVRTVQPVVATLDREAEEAAEVLGASTAQRFWRVILPQLAPAVVTAFGLAFARSVNEYGVAVLVSGNVAFETLVGPVYVYQRIEAFDYAGATAVAAALLALCLAVLGATHAFQRRSARHGG